MRLIRSIRDTAAIRLPHRTVYEIFSTRTTAARAVALRIVDLDPPDPANPRFPHVHRRTEEVILVVAGHGSCWVDGATHPVAEDDAIYIRPGARHMTVNDGPGRMRLYCFFPNGRPEDDTEELPDVRTRE